jgi:hypothetical protein
MEGEAQETATRMPRTAKPPKQFQSRPRTPVEDVQETLSALPQSMASVPPSPELPNAPTPPTLPKIPIPPNLPAADSLKKQLENAGDTFLKDKVGLTPDALVKLAQQETGVDFVSTFKDAQAAEKSILAAMAANKAKIEAWLAKARKELLVMQHTMDEVVGLWAKRGSPEAVATSAMQLAMQAQAVGEDAYKIVSAFPVPEA